MVEHGDLPAEQFDHGFDGLCDFRLAGAVSVQFFGFAHIDQPPATAQEIGETCLGGAKRDGGGQGGMPAASQTLGHHRRIIGLRDAGMSIARTAELAGCSIAQIKGVTALHRAKAAFASDKGGTSTSEGSM